VSVFGRHARGSKMMEDNRLAMAKVGVNVFR